MQLPDNLTPEQSEAIIECLRMFARHGRQLRLQRERAEQEKAKTADALGSAATVKADDNGTSLLPKVNVDAP
jgi:hypothetical protein